MNDAPLCVSPRRASELLGLSPRQVYNLVASGALVARKLGARTGIDYKSVVAYFEAAPLITERRKVAVRVSP